MIKAKICVLLLHRVQQADALEERLVGVSSFGSGILHDVVEGLAV